MWWRSEGANSRSKRANHRTLILWGGGLRVLTLGLRELSLGLRVPTLRESTLDQRVLTLGLCELAMVLRKLTLDII